jgi:hypothetical protein
VTRTQARYNGAPPRQRHRLRTLVIAIAVIVAGLLGLDFAARAYAENRVATDVQNQGFPGKPDVTIEGFPFLTQLLSRRFPDVLISAGSFSDGPVTLHSVHATLTSVRVNSSYNGGTIGRLRGTAAITFGDLARAFTARAGALSSLGQLRLAAAGPDKVRASLHLAVASASAVWRVSMAGRTLRAQLVSSTGVPSALLGALGTLSVRLPALPLGLAVTRVSVTPAGLTGTLSARHVRFGG